VYDYSTVPAASAFPGTALAGQDGWVLPGGGSVTVRNDLNAVPGMSGNNAYNSAAGVYATRKNSGAWSYAVPANATAMRLSLVGRINSTATAALGPAIDSSGNGSISSANALGEYGFEFGYVNNTWFVRQAAQGTTTATASLGLNGSGRTWLMELRVDLQANGGNGAGSMFVRQLGDTANQPVNDTLNPVPTLQNVNLGILRMSANGGNSSPAAWDGLLTRIAAGNLDTLTVAWSTPGVIPGAPQLFAFTGGLSNDGERIALRDGAGTIVDEVTYQSEFPWPVGARGTGKSMQLINPALDNDLGGSWRSATPTPGAQNGVYSTNAPPQLRQVDHLPKTPLAAEPVTITVKASDPDGVGAVTLLYQTVAPGNFVPAFFALPYATLVANPNTPRTANPAFEAPANWQTVTMRDDGLNGDALAGDGVFTGTIPGQANRTLIRYRISATDTPGANVRVPYADDPSLNFACFAYNGVPAWTAAQASVHPEGAGHVYPATLMNSLPVHTLITRNADLRSCYAYSSLGDSGQQIPKANEAARSEFNWEGAFVFDGVVYDHMHYRLRQSNDRYSGNGKRSMKFRFNDGHRFQGRDELGKKLPVKLESLNTAKMSRFGGANEFGLREVVNSKVWRLFGVDAPVYYHAHMRVIDGADEAPSGATGQYSGDFFGLALFYDSIDGPFLDNRELPDGNLYKWKDGFTAPATLQTNQSRDAVTDGSDFTTIFTQLRPERDDAWLRARVDYPQWYRYHAICEALRHYDFGVTSSHLKNRAWYFMPAPGGPLLRHVPHDHDATWYAGYHDGLTVGIGVDFAMQAIYGYNGTTEKTAFTPEYRNTLRELRNLLWREETIHDIIDRATANIAEFSLADRDRWLGGPADAGAESSMPAIGTIPPTMKSFAFVQDTVNGAPLAGGRAKYIEQLAADTALPGTPGISYAGTPGYPTNGVVLQSSNYAFSGGSGPFAAMQWRVAEITDAAAPAFDPLAPPMYEITPEWETTVAAPFQAEINVPTLALRPGHTYRARVRHLDATGRASHWSAPLQFTATSPDVAVYRDSLVISEIMFNPAGGNSDLEFVEVLNTGAATLDLTDVRLTKGIDFDFAGSAITSLAPGARVLVVRDLAAFAAEYGAGLPVAGEYRLNDENNLSNGGEQLKLSFGAGIAIQDFIYDEDAPWPSGADGTGRSLVLIAPATRPDHSLPQNWRPSAAPGGSPGTGDAVSFTGTPLVDVDKDSLAALLEYALGTDDNAPGIPAISFGGNPPAFTVEHALAADDAALVAEISGDLLSWRNDAAAIVRISSTLLPSGRMQTTWQPGPDFAGALRLFVRLRATLRQ
jgi:CotH kinase protein/Lamin Tail Domain